MRSLQPTAARRAFPWPVLGRNLLAPNADADVVAVVLWWERRRLAYNLVVCVAGIVGMFAYLTVDQCYGQACVGDMAAFQAIGTFIGANVCYTAGCIVEALLRTARPLPASFAPRI